MKKLTIGILAHVDAGKTTLSEALLYRAGKIRTLGRVDHKNTYLDTNAVERERGITIFSKQARFSLADCEFILLDTPGHVDFSPEAERVLSLLDYAILLISAPDGVQSHTRTLWQLLEFYRVPTFLFINKTDISVRPNEEIEAELQKALSPACVAFYEDEKPEVLLDKLALTDEFFLNAAIAGDPIDDGDIADAVTRRALFPCFFGSALRMKGIDALLSGIDRYSLSPIYPETGFGARVYKINRSGALRLTYMKVTSGTLSVRDEISYLSESNAPFSEKIGQIRLYSGEKFEQVDTASAGDICAVSGLSATYVGQGLGEERNASQPILSPVLSYRVVLPDGCDPVLLFPRLKELEEEEPSLHLTLSDEPRQIEARFMGDIQIELLRRMIRERLSIDCTFDTGKILYQEKIAKKTVGVGHFEPLRHYAEVQLLMEPLPKGSGLVFDSRLPEDALSKNWQRLILSHLYEKTHRGTLTGAPLTDTKLTLMAGRAHLKHTEGGDFREATHRAVRHGLMKAGCVLLEPYYRFRLEIPSASVGRAMSDLQMRHAEFEVESASEEASVITGRAPVATMLDYAREVISYTRGKGSLSCVPDGYDPCHNAEEVIEAAAYDPEGDLENTPHSVFCAHGAGVLVPWQEVDAHKHLDASFSEAESAQTLIPRASELKRRYAISDAELEAIMLREFGPIKRRKYSEPRTVTSDNPKKQPRPPKPKPPQKRMTILDGYNIIHSWDSLKALAAYSLENARDALLDLLASYVAYTKTELVVVFDAYLVKNGAGSDFMRDGIRVVYTRQDETADTFIEAMMHELGPNYNIRVVTGDRLVQFSAVHAGISRMTAREFENEVTAVGNEISAYILKLAQQK